MCGLIPKILNLLIDFMSLQYANRQRDMHSSSIKYKEYHSNNMITKKYIIWWKKVENCR